MPNITTNHAITYTYKKKANGPAPPPNPNYTLKTRLMKVFKTNPVISLFDSQASHGHADDP